MGAEVRHAEDDADLLIVQTAIEDCYCVKTARLGKPSFARDYEEPCCTRYLLWYFGDLSVAPLRQSYSIGTP